MPSWRCSCSADIPGVWVLTRYAAQNHSVSAVRVACMIVPAVTEVCLPHALHCHTPRDRCRSPISAPPQRLQR
jgi:hypothetical protein